MLSRIVAALKAGAPTPPGFPVDDVKPASKFLPRTKLTAHLQSTLKSRIIAVCDPEEWVADAPNYHALVAAVHSAFSQHYPLRLDPDAIWMTIAQGASLHINENAEQLRGRFVKHEGKKELKALVVDLSPAECARAVEQFSSRIQQETDPALHDLFVCNFSTTTPTIRTASQLVLMDAYSKYFEYTFGLICGIPRIELTGTPNDWERIRERIEVFDTFGLEWWTPRLRPILDEFVRTANGKPDRAFWQAIYLLRGEKTNACLPSKPADGPLRITGWIVDLFPYLGTGTHLRRNPLLDIPRTNWHNDHRPGVAPSQLPTGISTVTVKLGASSFKFVGGLFGVQQSKKTLAVSPQIGWCVAAET